MTLKSERLNALKMAREFLLALLDRQETPRVPLYIRSRARSVLKHFICSYEIDQLPEMAPELFGEEFFAAEAPRKPKARGTKTQPRRSR